MKFLETLVEIFRVIVFIGILFLIVIGIIEIVRLLI